MMSFGIAGKVTWSISQSFSTAVPGDRKRTDFLGNRKRANGDFCQSLRHW